MSYDNEDDLADHNLNSWDTVSELRWSLCTDVHISSTRWITSLSFNSTMPISVKGPAGIHTWTWRFGKEDSGEQGAWVYCDGVPFPLTDKES